MQHRLIICTFGGQRAEVTLDQGEVYLGRDPDADIFINDPMLSALHAVFVPLENGIELFDGDSTNGTCVNGKPAERIRLISGDEIVFGNSVYALYLAASKTVPENVIEATSQILFHQPPGKGCPDALSARIEMLQAELGKVEERLLKRANTLMENTVREQNARGAHDRLSRANKILEEQYETRSKDLVTASKKLETQRRNFGRREREAQESLRGFQARTNSVQMQLRDAQEKLQRIEASISRQQTAKGKLEREAQTLKISELKRRDELLRLERELALANKELAVQ